jgi:hypothetical protein
VPRVRQSATPSVPFAHGMSPPLAASFDAGRLTSDGGLPWLAEADAALGVCAAVAACVPEWRRGPVRHALVDLVRQRVYQVACGYPDQDDADALRTDPALKWAVGRSPESGPDQASQPTLSRLENAVDRRAVEALAALAELYVRQRGADGPPARVLLDVDGTDDPAHGQQQGIGYHGYYRRWMYFPLLVFDADTGHLVTAVLRPGTVHGSRFVVLVLRRLLTRLCAAWPGRGRGGPRRLGLRGPARVRLVRGARGRLHPRPGPQPRARARGRPAAGRRPGPERRPRRRARAPGRRGRLRGPDLAAPPPGRVQGRGVGQETQHPLRRHHPRRSTAGRLRPLRRPGPGRDLPATLPR